MDGENKVILVEIRYEDGMILQAEGEDADRYWKAVLNAFSAAFVHGIRYRGPGLKILSPGSQSCE